MSDFLAIAAVTATLCSVIEDALAHDAVAGGGVSMAKVHPTRPGPNAPTPGITVHLLRVTPNAALANADLPTRDASGNAVSRPTAAVDLHYLISFHGDDAKGEAQRMMGTVVRTLHATPVLHRDLVVAALTKGTYAHVATSDLPVAFEPVRVTPVPLELEDLSRIWGLFDTPAYALALSYRASVVLIEGLEAPRTALPVQIRTVQAVPLQFPFIEEVVARPDPLCPILSSGGITMRGRNFVGAATAVTIDGTALAPASVTLGDRQIDATLPAVTAGVHAVQVVHRLPAQPPSATQQSSESNLVPFAVAPQVAAASYNGGTDTVQVDFSPALADGHRVAVVLNAAPAAGDPAPGYTIPVDPPPAAGDTSVTVSADGVEPGTYRTRLQVDGVVSRGDVDGPNPVTK